MNKAKFVLPVAVLGIAFVLSCSNLGEKADEVQQQIDDNQQQIDDIKRQVQCSATQGEWDADLKKCVKCPDGMTKQGIECVATGNVFEGEDGTTTIICPPKTKLNGSGVCVANAITTDSGTVASSNLFCDYGKPDPKEESISGIGCFTIEYAEECDKDWGKLVKSCNDKDRRRDAPNFCDYGPIDPAHGGGCYRILNNGSDCDTEWGIVADKCGTQGRWPDGTVCPAGKSEVLNECRKTSEIGDRNGIYCDYGPFKLNNLDELEGGCWDVLDQKDRTNCLKWGKGVNTCPTSYTCPTGWQKTSWNGCEKISTPITCSSGYTLVNGSCVPNISTSCPTGYTLVNGSCVQNQTQKEYCDWGPPDISDVGSNGVLGGGCWPIDTQEDRYGCYNIVPSCPNYTCPTGSAKTNFGAGESGCAVTNTNTSSSSKVNPSPSSSSAGNTNTSSSSKVNPSPSSSSAGNTPQTDKYCYFGRVDDCWAIGVASPETGEVLSEASCEDDYGMVVTSCLNVVVQYCDWGQPVLKNGKVDKGCWAIKNSTERSSCVDYSDYGPLTSCPNYTCPAGTQKADFGWGDSGCIIE